MTASLSIGLAVAPPEVITLEDVEREVHAARVAEGRVQPQRVDLYDVHGRRVGYATVDGRGRVDTYDTRSNRTGYGTLSPDGTRVDFFDVNSNRVGSGRIK